MYLSTGSEVRWIEDWIQAAQMATCVTTLESFFFFLTEGIG